MCERNLVRVNWQIVVQCVRNTTLKEREARESHQMPTGRDNRTDVMSI